MSRASAQERTDALAQIAGGMNTSYEGLMRIMAAEIKLGTHRALGLARDEWVARVDTGLIRYTMSAEPERRRAAVGELTAPVEDGGEGLSNREAADVLGVDETTVRRDTAANAAPVEPESPLVGESEEGRAANAAPEPSAKEQAAAEPSGEDVEPSRSAHVANNSGDNEWYTPAEYIAASRAVMGDIDLDPASSAMANDQIHAKTFYTVEDDGLVQSWKGRVWMNPPYAQPLVDRFCARLAREFSFGEVSEACALVNNATETGWFQTLAAEAAAVCFPRGRVRFWHPEKRSAPLQGQALIYLGPRAALFKREFVRFGFVAVVR